MPLSGEVSLDMTVAIINAAGHGERLDTKQDTAFLCIGSRPIVAYSMMAFESCSDIDQILLIVPSAKADAARGMAQMFGISKLVAVVSGSAKRQASIAKGLAALPPEAQYVVIHDASRPLVTPEIISETIKTAGKYGSGVAAYRVVDGIKEASKTGIVSNTIESAKLWAVETPQTFRFELIQRAYDEASKSDENLEDDAAAVERIGEQVRLVEWNRCNIKVRTADDLATAAQLLHK